MNGMNGCEIQREIERLNLEIEREILEFGVNRFTLDSKVEMLRREIYNLQCQCPHLFIDESCVYCGIDKEDVEDEDNPV